MSQAPLDLPQSKHDLERAHALVALGFPGVEPVLPRLLEWIQDMNWPVAQVLAPFLAEIGRPLAPHIRQVLQTDDLAWQDYILSGVVLASPELIEELRPQIERLALHPTPIELADGITFTARWVLGLPEDA
jgi:hypothetical protein